MSPSIRLRVAVAAALVGFTIAMVHVREGGLSRGLSWRAQTSARPLQGDILYRSSLALETMQRSFGGPLGLDPDDLAQAGIAVYERAALVHDHPNAHAMLRLAVIYSKQGNADEGLALLARLVQLDEERTPFYLAVSTVYDPKTVPVEELRKAGPIIQAYPDWIPQLVMPDYYRRLGDERQAERAQAEAARSHRRFAKVLVGVVVCYLTLGLVGIVVLGRLAFRKFFRLPQGAQPRRFPADWGHLEALETWAVLLAATALVGWGAGELVHRLQLNQTHLWVAAVLLLVSYLLYSGAALLLIWARLRAKVRSVFGALGLGGWPSVSQVLAGVTGYGVLVASFLLAALLARWVGLSDVPVAGPSAPELMEQARQWPEIAVFVVLMCIAAPVAEELVFRGFVYAGLRQRLQVAPAVVLSAVLFAVAHVNLALEGMVLVACVGALLAYLYEHHGSLWPSITAHALHNALTTMVILSVNH